TATSGNVGFYQFDNLTPGTYQVREVLQASWNESYPSPGGTYTITVVSGQTVAGRTLVAETPNFGNYQQGRISGLATHEAQVCTGFEDRGGQSGVRIFLDLNGNGQFEQDEPNTLTDANGRFQFTGLTPGSYAVREVLLPGWTQLTANPPPAVVTSGQEVTGLTFRNRIPPTAPLTCGTISGRITYQEPTCVDVIQRGGLGGVTVFLDDNNNGRLDDNERRTTTDVNGNFRFTDLGAGTYHVRQVLPAGGTQISASGTDFTQPTGIFTVEGVTFQDQLPPSTALACGSISGQITSQ